jgi:hypothetical protein
LPPSRQATRSVDVDVRDQGGVLSPELLGALALVVDHLGDSYLLPPIRAWIDEDSKERAEHPDFAALCSPV